MGLWQQIATTFFPPTYSLSHWALACYAVAKQGWIQRTG